MKTFYIRVNHQVKVRKVELNEILQEGDLYFSTSGNYDLCPCPGIEYQGGVVFYRPIK